MIDRGARAILPRSGHRRLRTPCWLTLQTSLSGATKWYDGVGDSFLPGFGQPVFYRRGSRAASCSFPYHNAQDKLTTPEGGYFSEGIPALTRMQEQAKGVPVLKRLRSGGGHDAKGGATGADST